ncbi:hypothetical protein ASPZODRAFT_65185 [Penicilliopsis zonata CBS 506.65]|uniref:Tyrosinase copper-binding domain-containing protein n=1 Tax=Penicilliopsis zonata CBS 506.65 TaxID=1073090 RepID=A0A1L9SJA1_9EURO|nr:hypothetical protein ASPZODRAFT_65185 [Penicilliopsis zonata CBS 506.65]OJJ47300.1 hypothetical protein ASPZODRAFT_65185 [Penicilliopsis zonata CBS 506.65]
MVGFKPLVWGLLACQPLAQAYLNAEDAASASELSRLVSQAYNQSIDSLSSSNGSCTLETVHVRRNWDVFSTAEKKEYIDAVLCLQSTSPKTPASVAPGVKTRYDDFVATHINQTLEIHYTGTFLIWHRTFVWVFDQALREECGYSGAFPYWDWPSTTENLEKSSVFDGSDTSLSGNGWHIPHEGEIVLSLGDYAPVILPPGNGGGCVVSGPFVNYTINLGPAALALPGNRTLAVANPLDYNPRCFRRDLTTEIIRSLANYTAVVDLITQNDDIWDFEMVMQGVPGSGVIGVHGGGHYSMGGDPGRDLYVSPGDPAFWHHHRMIDRVYWIWQNLDPATRITAISGTGTFLNDPVSANTTLDTEINYGYAVPGQFVMRDLMSTIEGKFCYIYE